MNRLVFIGASGHGKVCAEIAEKIGYKNIFFLDDNTKLLFCGGYPVTGVTENFKRYLDGTTSFFIAIGNPGIRQRITEEIEKERGKIVTLIHPNAIIGNDVEIGSGSVVMAGAIINPGTVIGKSVIINTASSVDHDCYIGNYGHVSVGAHIAGTVNIGMRTWVGAGAIVINNINICSDCMIGAGAVVVKDISKTGTYVGIPARGQR